MPPPDDSISDPASDLDWGSIQALSTRRLHDLLNGLSREDIEDAVGDAMVRCVSWVNRLGPPDSAVAMACVVARRVAADALKRKAVRSASAPKLEEPEMALVAPDEREIEESLEELRWGLFVCESFLERYRGVCRDLAGAIRDGQQLKEFASLRGESPEKTRQTWKRCRKALFHAIRSGRVRLDWRIPEDH